MILSPAALTTFVLRYLFHYAVGGEGGGGVAIGAGGGGGSSRDGLGFFPGKGNVLLKKYEDYIEPVLIVTEQEGAHTAVAPTAVSSNKWNDDEGGTPSMCPTRRLVYRIGMTQAPSGLQLAVD